MRPAEMMKKALAAFTGSHFSSTKPTVPAEPPVLDDEVQLAVATETALAAAVGLIILQQQEWNQLVDALEASGTKVSVTLEAQMTYALLMKRLNAAMKVAGEVVGIDKETMERLFNE
jgi:hypothetical protein